MKLKVMNCKNCNAPLQLQDDKLVCAFCGGVFEIEKDRSDVEFEKYANADKYILQSLQNQKAEMEEYYRHQEEEKIRQEQERERRLKEERKERARKARRKTFVHLIICVILAAIAFYALKYLVDAAKTRKAEMQAANEAAAIKNRTNSYRITDTLLKKDPETLDMIWQLAVDYERNEQHDGAVIESSEDIWNLKSDPELVEQYLFTTERHSGIYMLLKVTLETDDGRSKELYDCIVVRDLTYDSDGNLVFPEEIEVFSAKASDYDYFWRGSFDEELVRTEIFESRKTNFEEHYYFFEL